MRPTRLELEGFTAFRERTVVDFEGAELFALTGATGSGKTSLLDAIVFVLYGTVPRLADQRAVAPIVAQGMAEARVRLDFTVGTDAYTATRVVRRTKTGANTAEARLERDGEVIAGNADDVSAEVASVLGLSYEHFTKCVMLPQGEFARFLHDKPKDRQDLLVSLLDLGLYGRMAELAGQRSSAAKSEASVLEGRLGDLAGASPEAVAAARARVDTLASLVAELDQAAPELEVLAAESAAAMAAATQLTADARLLASTRVPEGLVELHDRSSAAAQRVAGADAALVAVEARRVAATAALAALPDRSELLLVREAHDRLDGLLERRAKEQRMLAERATDEAAAAATLETAESALTAARADEEAALAAHRAHAVRADLVVGEPCPVCLHEVATLPGVAAPRALQEPRKRRDKADRDQRAAAETYAAAKHAMGVAEATLVQLTTEVEAAEARVEGLASRDKIESTLAEIDACRLTAEAATTAEDEARRAMRDATRERDAIAMEERDAEQRYNVARDGIAALGPPARLRRGASLVDEWQALAVWAEGEAVARRDESERQSQRGASAADRRRERVAELVGRCRECDVDVPSKTDPAGAASRALGAATAAHAHVVEQAASAERLRTDLAAVAARGGVAKGLATHLDARHFEKWVLDEAMTALAEGATELLGTLSGGQYALRLDAKTAAFCVVDHRNADEVRSARTLSGGETFLASLALALALADRIAVLAARGAPRLESIFLDEGFGTLDADTLDVVASAIEELGASGRLVGVVSHVADLAERLPVRFEVQRAGNASSVERVDR